MAHIVTERCIGCKHTNCVAVCPVNCFREGENFLVIDPDVCIDCALCVRECPVEAIYDEVDLPDEWAEFKEMNAQLSKSWPAITAQKQELATAVELRDTLPKRQLLKG